jgi:predicted RND superfamily exporter protein
MVGGKTFLPVVIVSMTMNGNVAAISFATILMIVSFVFMLMSMLGWKINVIESIGLSLAAGLSVDYVLHLMHAYDHHGADTPEEKMRSALTEMGISVTYGCMTSFSPDAPSSCVTSILL